MDEKSGAELLDQFLEENQIFHFEGDSGVENLNKICRQIGYPGHQFKYGSALESFLSDNPGAQQAIVDWIREYADKVDEWKESLKIEPEEDIEEEEDES